MSRKLVATVVAVIAALTASGCSTVADHLNGAPPPTGKEAPASDPGPILVTNSWGVVDGMLSVVVVNTTDRTLKYAEGVVTARTADDQLVSSSLEYADAACCKVLQLGPGQEYGFYVDVGSAGDDIARVDVAYRNVSWEPATAVADHTTVTATPVGLHDGHLGTVVLANLTSNADVPAVVAQAFLTDDSGQIVAVVSGRWTCVQPGTRELRMQLFHPVPAGTQVADIQVHAVETDPSSPAPHCTSSRPL